MHVSKLAIVHGIVWLPVFRVIGRVLLVAKQCVRKTANQLLTSLASSSGMASSSSLLRIVPTVLIVPCREGRFVVAIWYKLSQRLVYSKVVLIL